MKIWTVIFVFLLHSCANIVPPNGGKKDTTPPITSNTSPEQNSTNFKGKELIIEFNEYVNFKDPEKNIFFSPPLKGKPKFTMVGKKAIIAFGEELKPDITYHITFNSAIEDFHESNSLNRFDFVFSTGEKIDSEEIQGLVFDAKTFTKEKDITIAIGKSHKDLLENNFSYLDIINENGAFNISNIKKGKYYLVSFFDENGNKKIDPFEKIGFIDTPILTKKNEIHQLLTYQPVQKQKLLTFKNEKIGKIEMEFVNPLQKISVEGNILHDNNFKTQLSEDKKTIVVWYNSIDSQEAKLFIAANGESKDTVEKKLKTFKNTNFEEKKLQLLKSNSERNSNSDSKRNPLLPVNLLFDLPIDVIQTNKIRIFEDTGIAINTIIKKGKTIGSIEFDYKWKPKKKYKILMPDSSITSIYKTYNKYIIDSFETSSANEFGNIDILLHKIDPQKDYLISIYRDEKEIYSSKISKSTTFTKTLEQSSVGAYKIIVYHDKNKNGKWDIGNFSKLYVAEPSWILKQFNYNGGVDMQIDVDLK